MKTVGGFPVSNIGTKVHPFGELKNETYPVLELCYLQTVQRKINLLTEITVTNKDSTMPTN